MKNKRFLTFLFCLVLTVSAQGYSPEYDENGELTLLRADRNRDGYINIADIGHVASAWLEQDCGLSNPCEGADIFPEGGDGVVDFRDFAVHAEAYGLCTDPENPNCVHVPLTLYEPPTGSNHDQDLYSKIPVPGQQESGLWLTSSYGRSGNQGATPLQVWMVGSSEPHPHLWGSCGGGSFGTYGDQGAKPLVPGGGGVYNNTNMGWIFHDVTFGADKAPGGAGDDDYVFGNWGFGTYGNQGIKPLWPILPSLPGGGGDIFFSNPQFALSGGDFGDQLLIGYTGSYGTYGNQGAKPLLPSLPGCGGGDEVYSGLGLHSSEPMEPGETHGEVLTGHTGSYGTYGNQGAKPLLPSLPEDEYPYFSGITTYEVSADNGFVTVPTPSLSSYGTYGKQGAKPILPLLPGGGGPSVHRFSAPTMSRDGSAGARWMGPGTGEVRGFDVDMYIPSRGPDFVWGRIYRSRTGDDTTIGNNWDHSCNIYLEPYGSSIIVNDGTGRKDLCRPSEPNTWTADGFFRELTHEDDESFTLTFPHKGTWKFLALNHPNAPGKISAITDRNGNSLTFDYDSQGRLTTVHDTLDTAGNSRDITINYNAGGLIESVTDWAERQVRYEYYAIGDPNGSAGDLKSVTTPAVSGTPTGNDFLSGKTTTYTYTKGFSDDCLNHNLLTITDPNGQTYLQNTYGTGPNDPNFDHVVRQILGNPNDIIDITYAQVEPCADNNYAGIKAVTNDRMGNVTERFYDNLNRLVIFRRYTGRADPNQPTSLGIDPNVNMPTGKLRSDDPPFFETRYQYNKHHLPTRIDYPNGNYRVNVYEFDLDANAPIRSCGNLREVRRLAGSLEAVSDQNEIVHSFEYDPNVNNGTNFLTRYVNPRENETLYDYEPNGNRIRTERIRPADSNITYEWQYNQHGQLTAAIGPNNGSGSRRRDEYTYYAIEGDPNYGYLKETIVDANNLALTATYQYDDVGNVTRVTDRRGHDTQYIVNQLNQVVRRTSREVTDSSGIRYERDYYFDENDNLVQVDVQNKNEQGVLQPNTHFTTTFEYDILNRLTRTSEEVNSVHAVVTEYEYDDNGNRTLIRFGEATNGNQPNNVIRALYDERNLVFQTIRADGDPNQSTTQYDYDGNGYLKKVQQGLEATPHVSTFEHDGFGRLVEANNPMGNIIEYDYDAAGNLVVSRVEGELVDAPGDTNNVRLYESHYEYDTLNRLTSSVVSFFDPNTQGPIGDGNSVTQFFYSDNSQITKVADDRGNETRCEYDTANRRSLVTDAKDNTVTYSYDENSNVTAVTETEISDLGEPNETFITSYQYDNLDRLVMDMDNMDNTSSYDYDSGGSLVQVTDARDNETRYEYDGLDRLIQTVRDMDGDGADAGDANDIVTAQSWDDSSRVVSRTDDNGNSTTYEYDALNRRTKTTYADGTDKRFVYDVHDNIVQTTDGSGTVVDSAYDVLGRLTAKDIAPGAGVSNDTTFENYKYDGLSRLIFAQDNDSNLTLGYDSLSNVITETLNGETTSSVYDGLGNRLSCSYPGGRVITCTYDELNRKKTISDAPGEVASYDYIGPGRVERRSYGNGTECSRAHDDVKRITATTHVFDPCGPNTVVDSRTYTWDETYNKTQRKDTRTGGPELTHDYTYDAVSRLVHTKVTDAAEGVVRETDYSLDGVGNRTEVAGSPDPGRYSMDVGTPEPADKQMNQYTTTPFDSRLYDKTGNLSTIDNGEATQKDVVYDYRGHVVEVNDSSTGQIHTYAYDALGRRIEKVIDSDGSPQITRFFYGCPHVIEEQDAGGSTLATYVYGNYGDEVLNMQRDANDYYYHTDDLYNVMAVTDANGLVVERYEYLDYGEPNLFDGSGTPISSTAIGNSYLFTGRRYDRETGWYYYRARYLDPVAGRFTSRDTIGLWGDEGNLGNGTTYVGNNPWTVLDPLGTCSTMWGRI